MTALGFRLDTRTLCFKNTSVVPIAIDWHTFVVKPTTETLPFNVILDVSIPFTDKLASRLKARRYKTDSETHMENHIELQTRSETLTESSSGNDTLVLMSKESSRISSSNSDNTLYG